MLIKDISQFDLYFVLFILFNCRILRGGVMSGFRHVEEETYETRLLHFCGTRKVVEIKEVSESK